MRSRSCGDVPRSSSVVGVHDFRYLRHLTVKRLFGLGMDEYAVSSWFPERSAAPEDLRPVANRRQSPRSMQPSPGRFPQARKTPRLHSGRPWTDRRTIAVTGRPFTKWRSLEPSPHGRTTNPLDRIYTLYIYVVAVILAISGLMVIGLRSRSNADSLIFGYVAWSLMKKPRG